jgi:hypothetical protein
MVNCDELRSQASQRNQTTYRFLPGKDIDLSNVWQGSNKNNRITNGSTDPNIFEKAPPPLKSTFFHARKEVFHELRVALKTVRLRKE